jgi:hypothetical protein
VAFESRKFNDAELNYQTTEKEMLAVVHALRVWRCYLEGAEFTVYTDHVSNTYFQTQPNLSRRQARWSEFLQRFGAYKWKYRKGTKNVADALSRRDVAGSVWRFCLVCTVPSCWYCRGCRCRTPRGVLAYHHPWPGRRYIRRPGQC